MNNQAQLGKTYRIYGKMEGMKRMQAVAGCDFTKTLIHADLYVVRDEEDQAKLERELAYLNTQGQFELRAIKIQ